MLAAPPTVRVARESPFPIMRAGLQATGRRPSYSLYCGRVGPRKPWQHQGRRVLYSKGQDISGCRTRGQRAHHHGGL